MTAPIDVFAGIQSFVLTAEERSFRRAATRLGVTAAAVSKAVAKLEQELGVRLLNRTSRSVALTPEGTLFLERCRDAVANVQGARDQVKASRTLPRGEVTVTLPFILGRTIVPKLTLLNARYPGLSFRLMLTDRYARMLEENIDVAVRVGDLADSSLVARRLRNSRWITVASPAYLARHGTPLHPRDLERHNCLRFMRTTGKPQEWMFRMSPDNVEITKVSGSLLIDQGEMLLESAAAGLGVAQVPDFMLQDADRTRFVEVLTEYSAEGLSVHALCLPGRERSPNVRVFLEFLREIFPEGT